MYVSPKINTFSAHLFYCKYLFSVVLYIFVQYHSRISYNNIVTTNVKWSSINHLSINVYYSYLYNLFISWYNYTLRESKQITIQHFYKTDTKVFHISILYKTWLIVWKCSFWLTAILSKFLPLCQFKKRNGCLHSSSSKFCFHSIREVIKSRFYGKFFNIPHLKKYKHSVTKCVVIHS